MLQVWTPPLTGLQLLASFRPWASLCSRVKWEPRGPLGRREKESSCKGECAVKARVSNQSSNPQDPLLRREIPTCCLGAMPGGLTQGSPNLRAGPEPAPVPAQS